MPPDVAKTIWTVVHVPEDAEPGFQVPWHNWQPYGAILLSDRRRGAGS